MTRSHGLNDEEYAALRALQDAAPAPSADHSIWTYLVSSNLVWIDRSVRPAAVRLTTTGRIYAPD